MMTIARDDSIKKGGKIIEDINAVVNSWLKYAIQAEVRQDLKERIQSNLNTF